MSVPPEKMRFADGGIARDNTYVYNPRLSITSLTDPVRLVLPPPYVLPIVFVPGIMGSNLMNLQGNSLWSLNTVGGIPLGLAGSMLLKTAGDRQKLMHPARTKVDPSGNTPSKPVGSVTHASEYVERGWGEVAEGSYHSFLLWLEKHLNGQGYNPAKWQDFYYTSVSATPQPGETPPEPKLYPGILMNMPGLPRIAEIGHMPAPVMSDDLLKRAGFRMPVYACGYNWLASNQKGAEALKDRIINTIIKENNTAHSKCKQVIIVTHSMGGLVARACQKLEGMQEIIAGIVHGVMPTVGAAVAYRRCKIGMRDEDWKSGMAIGEDGPSVTAVFAQAPGALQLLPTTQYSQRWLTFSGPSNNKIAATQPASSDPYKDIYLCQDKWWGLVRKEWLHPKGGIPIDWVIYVKNVAAAKNFHGKIILNAFHPNTYVFYGKDPAQKSFDGIHWHVTSGNRPDNKPHVSMDQVPALGFDKVRDDGANPLHVGGETVYQPSYSPFGGGTTYQTAYWELRCATQDGGGDGTVPISSGAAPRYLGGGAIKQQFGLTGFAHEGAYRDSDTTKIVALYAIQKIAGTAKVSA